MKNFFKSIEFKPTFTVTNFYTNALISVFLFLIGILLAALIHSLDLKYIIFPQPLASNQFLTLLGFVFDALLLWGIFQLKLFRYRLNLYQYFITLLVSVIFFYLRFQFQTQRNWDFLPLVGPIKIIDVPIILISFISLLSLIKEFFKTKKGNEKVFLEDTPLTNHANNKRLIENLKPVLFNDYYSNAFSVAVIGKWGAGKSSFLNEIINEVIKESEKNKNLLLIQFSPFLNHGDESIIQEFFSLFRSQLRTRSGKLSNKLMIYGDKLSNAIKEKNPLELFRSKNISDTHTAVGELYEEIKEALEQLNLKIVVTIDDVDRLNASEITQVLKLIRNTANFPNIVFVVAFDKYYVLKTLEIGNDKYLEKYFQLELHVSKVSKQELVDSLINQLGEKLLNERIVDSNSEECNPLFKTILELNLNTHRDVNRLINQIRLDKGLCTERGALEIDPLEIIYLSILKLFYWKTFEKLRRETIHFLQYKEEYQFIQLISEEGQKPISQLNADEVRSVGNLTGDNSTNDINYILLGLFGTFKDQNSDDFQSSIPTTSIKRVNKLKFYLERTMPSDEISSEEFNQLIIYSDKELTTAISSYYESKNSRLIQLYIKLKEWKTNDIEQTKRKALIHFLILAQTENVWQAQMNGIEDVCLELISEDEKEFSKLISKLLNENLLKVSIIGNFVLRIDSLKWTDKYNFNDIEWLHLIWKLKVEKNILVCFNLMKDLIHHNHERSITNALRDLFFTKIQPDNYEILEKEIIQRVDRKTNKIFDEDIQVFGKLASMLREMESPNIEPKSPLTELIRLNILQETDSNFKFNFSYEKFSQKEVYNEVQIIYSINDLELFNKLEENDFKEFCNNYNIHFEKYLSSNNNGSILKCRLIQPDRTIIEELVYKFRDYYKQTSRRTNTLSSIDHYNIRTYVSNDEDIVNMLSIQGFK